MIQSVFTRFPALKARLIARVWLAMVAGSAVQCACAQESKSQVAKSSSRPPYHGTIFIAKDILTSEDPTAWTGLQERGQGERRMFDRRKNAFGRYEAWIFDASFDDGLSIEVQVNAEMDQATAKREAETYLKVVGQMPYAVRTRVETMWIHPGKELFGGGNRNLLIHVEQGVEYARDGILEETLIHEASHTSLDSEHARSEGWREAQRADAGFISKYAMENPEREDIAESYLLCFAMQHRRSRLPKSIQETVRRVMPHRLAYFELLELDVRPVVQLND